MHGRWLAFSVRPYWERSRKMQEAKPGLELHFSQWCPLREALVCKEQGFAIDLAQKEVTPWGPNIGPEVWKKIQFIQF